MSGGHGAHAPSAHGMNLSAGVASVAVALVLVGVKLWALAATGALTIAATLADSALDLMMSLTALAAIGYAARPADDDHAFGHTSAEDLAALAQAVVILVSAGAIGVAGVRRLLADAPPAIEAEGVGAVALMISVLLTGALVLWQRRVVARTGNAVVAADSLHYVGDLIPTAGALIALWASAQFGLTRIDAVIAIAAAIFMGVGARGIGRRAFDALMDRAAPDEVIAGIAAICDAEPGIESWHDLKTRQAGSRIFVNLHVEIDGDMTLTDAHAIGARLRRSILAAYPQADVLIHKDPLGDPGE